MVGYTKFLKRSWFDIIFSWTTTNGMLGCYQSDDVRNCYEQPNAGKPENSHRRVKRWDNFVRNEDRICSVHSSALALGVVGLHLEYLLEIAN